MEEPEALLDLGAAIALAQDSRHARYVSSATQSTATG
jgi:hypothetical protein